MTNCFYHPEVDSINTCSKCGQAICTECNYVTGTHPICRNCWEKWDSTHVPSTSSALETRATPATSRKPIASEPSTAHNTSGEGKGTIVPPEIQGWNWGAFFLNWVWGISNRVWIALIVFIPIPLLAFIMTIVLGIKGNQWAWQNKRWDSIEHFHGTQRMWRNWGIGLFIASIILGAILFITGLLSGINVPSA